MTIGVWLIITTILFLVAIALIVFFCVPHSEKIPKVFVPEGFILNDKFIAVDSTYIVTFYLPLQNLNNLGATEISAIEAKQPLTIEQIRDTFSPPEDIYTKCLQWLQQYGQVWISPTKTTGILYVVGSNIQKMVGKQLYTSFFGNPVTQNDIFVAPYGMELSVNSVYDTESVRMTMLEYKNTQNLIDYDAQIKNSDFYSYDRILNSIGITGQTGTAAIGILSGGKVHRDLMKKAAVDLGYPEDQFNDNISECYIAFAVSSPGFLDAVLEFPSQGAKDVLNPPLSEVNLDCLTCCAARPQGKVISFNFKTTTTECTFSDITPMIWVSGVKIFSCSYSMEHRKNTSYIDRCNIETRLLSLFGINIFSSSGDQGIFNSLNNSFATAKFAVSRPDGTPYTPGAIKVGGFSTSEELKKAGYSFYLPMQFSFIYNSGTGAFFSSKSFTTSGGYYRGIKRADYKNNPAKAYENSLLWTPAAYYNTANGEKKAIPEFQIDFSGDIFPDLCNYGNLYNNYIFPDQELPFNGGTSFSSPLTASTFQVIMDNTNCNFVSLQRQLYSNLRSFLRPVAVGNNSLNNLNGYQSNLKTTWDPINGLGMPLYPDLLKYFSS